MANYQFIDHTADLAIKVYGKTVEEIFIHAALAWQKCIFEEAIPAPAEEMELHLLADSPEELLVEFLSEINYQTTIKQWCFSKIKQISVRPVDKKYELNALILGEKYDEKKHQIQMEIKAVTFHQLRIEKKDGLYQTLIVFDI
ncbi:MAG: archease [Calditrichia bacterium]